MSGKIEKLTGLEKYRAELRQKSRTGILDAAVLLFLKNGYDQVSLDDIAKQAKVSSATLYKHFPSKAKLFGGIMSRLWENEPETMTQMPQAGSPKEGLLEIGLDYAKLLNQPQTVALFRVVIAEVPRFPELGKELYERGKQPYLDRLNSYLQSEIENGTLEIGDVTLAVRQFLGMVNDIIFWPQLLVPSAAMSEDSVRATVTSAVDVFLSRYGSARQP